MIAVKEKAMSKLKEIKSKAEDTGSKARQYLDGILKIPFKIFKNEPIFDVMSNIKIKYESLIQIDSEVSTILDYITTDSSINNLHISKRKKHKKTICSSC